MRSEADAVKCGWSPQALLSSHDTVELVMRGCCGPNRGLRGALMHACRRMLTLVAQCGFVDWIAWAFARCPLLFFMAQAIVSPDPATRVTC